MKAVMVHGRPENEYCCMEVSKGEESRSRGWRRCHSQMVWQAIVAVLMVLAIEQAAMDAGFADGCGWCRLFAKRGK